MISIKYQTNNSCWQSTPQACTSCMPKQLHAHVLSACSTRVTLQQTCTADVACSPIALHPHSCGWWLAKNCMPYLAQTPSSQLLCLSAQLQLPAQQASCNAIHNAPLIVVLTKPLDRTLLRQFIASGHAQMGHITSLERMVTVMMMNAVLKFESSPGGDVCECWVGEPVSGA